MEDHQQAESPQNLPNAFKNDRASSLRPAPPCSAWRTAAHLYFPFITVALYMTFGSPFNTIQANIICIVLSAIPTYWLASLFYPTDRPEPTPRQAVRFSRKSDIYRAAILYTYRWLFGTPFNLQFFLADFATTYLISVAIAERSAGTQQRRSEFIVHLTLVAINAVLIFVAPSFLGHILSLIDRMIWRAAYIALVDDVVGVLTRPNLKTRKGNVLLVVTQAFTILLTSWMLLRWKRDLILSYQNDEEFQAALAGLELKDASDDVGLDFEDDGDRFLVDDEG
ncbi:uncharacterized protein M421DRAFT_425900 [Didymella exigua CBS 183.55]|uniref:Uncharacterized protein n=1 Tax=Didymella exigua CBS 183.55 TaxID=1150837 RepID=A0A6A5R8S3_9PLEO|nr:uncharacterized protein M421DRAFT_425900 [Didymella exigua CBS 183.55]KAF1923374.1 hypothetical protein M421DRAFT_425900 [Didymella exigua CBS 183.55]